MAKIKKIQESGTTIYPATITNAVKDPETGKTIPEILKEREEDTYPKMTVGFAQNVVGDGSTTEEEFSFRPTAGVNRNTLNDGAARIHSIKGRSVVANQHSKLRNDDLNNQTINGISMAIENDEIVFNGTATSSAVFQITDIRPLVKGHKYFVDFCTNYTDGGWQKYAIYIQNEYWVNLTDVLSGKPFIKEASTSVDVVTATFTVWGGITITNIRVGKKIRFIDLTKEFGAGNEPETVEEYYLRKPIGINEDEYNEGKLVNLAPQAIKTTGLNQFNGTYAKVLGGVQYYLGGNYTSVGFATEVGGDIEAITTPTSSEVVGGSAPDDRLYTPTQNGYIYANGESICISLYWPTEYGNLYGTYKPYKPFERDLGGIIAKYFTDGVMRSAGSAHDEIRWNGTKQKWEAVTRIGEVDLGDLEFVGPLTNSTNQYFRAMVSKKKYGYHNLLCSRFITITGSEGTGVPIGYISGGGTSTYIFFGVENNAYTNATTFKEAMRGVMLNYELADEYVTVQDIEENINFDYDVSDYGTEELIVAEGVESAPLSASIEYSPNVLAMLKNAPDIADDVDMLKSQLAALTAQLAALTATNNNE